MSADWREGVAAMVLAGGLGTRLRPVLADLPKPLAPIAGRPFICCVLDLLLRHGIRKAILCTGYRGDLVHAALGSDHAGLALEYSREPQPLGTGGALRRALSCDSAETLLVLNGDTYVNADLAAFAAGHRARGAQASLVLARAAGDRFGRVAVDPEGRILRFGEKESVADVAWANAGVYLLAREVVAALPVDVSVSLEHDVFPALAGRGLYGHTQDEEFLDIGTPESYAGAERFLCGSGAGCPRRPA